LETIQGVSVSVVAGARSHFCYNNRSWRVPGGEVEDAHQLAA
jgi:hypothetical protein